MKTLKAAALAVLWLWGTGAPGISAQVDSGTLRKGMINIRIFEGATESGALPSQTSISSFTQAGGIDTGEWEEDPEAQASRIQKAFNLKSVAITSSQRITLEKGERGPAYVKLRIPNKADLSLEFTVTDVSARKFLIEVFEQNGGTRSNLLSTEAGLPKATYTIFGFKDLRDNPYFVALQIGEWTVVPAGPVRKAGRDVKPPRLIKKVEPVYPETALEARAQGSVVVEAQTDIYGRVQSAKIVRSIPLLDQAALDAVRQWVYEPMLIDGKPFGVVFTVTLNFNLENEKKKSADTAVPAVSAEGPVRAVGQIKPPTLIKQVQPIYPPIAKQANVEGIVILEAMTDTYGRVAEVKVLRSVPLLDQAAIDAVRQWIYEPMVINGRPREVVFTVTVRFDLDKAKPAGNPMQLVPADGGAPIEVLQTVAPKYPVEAKKANLEGTVLLEAAIDDKGLVADVRILRPVSPALDKAAVEALKEWKFETSPLPVVGGKSSKRTVLLYARYILNPPAGAPETEIGGVAGGDEGGVVGGVVGGVIGGVEESPEGGVIKADLSDKAFREGSDLPPVRAMGDIKPPELVKRVDPIYPDIARAYRNSGVVILELTTDVYGRVQSAKVLRSVPNLDQAAIDAVRQWVYKPFLLDGKPRSCIFTVTVNFKLK